MQILNQGKLGHISYKHYIVAFITSPFSYLYTLHRDPGSNEHFELIFLDRAVLEVSHHRCLWFKLTFVAMYIVYCNKYIKFYSFFSLSSWKNDVDAWKRVHTAHCDQTAPRNSSENPSLGNYQVISKLCHFFYFSQIFIFLIFL